MQSPQLANPALKRPASAVRSRLWPPPRINIYEIQLKASGTPEAFNVSSKSFIFSKMLVSDTVGGKKAGVAHSLVLSVRFNST